MNAKTAIFATVIVASIVTVAGFNTAHADAYPAQDDWDYSWYVQDHKDVMGQLYMVESAWKVGIISDSDYFYELLYLWSFEQYLSSEFSYFDWDEMSNIEADYIKSAIDNPVAEKKLDALIASK